ncbi:hypothetical protein DH2020_028542 [Rehmannia glutinosa]|uniref:Glycoside hydrolase family 31 N-terminal domain-containing protein n=1 Tax=Rehmannia glutinosa TaxID=99300 RepID=A0ABR0VRY5_REHGL
MAGCEGKMVYQSIHEEGVFRFDCSEDDRRMAFPSLAFQNPIVRETQLKYVNDDPTYIPTFKCEKGQQIVNMMFPPNTSFYGTGEVSGPLERTGRKIVTWNTDSYAYGVENTSLYQSHPWVLAILPDGKAIGVLADTTRRCEIDLQERSNIKFTSSSSFPVITFGPFASPTDVLESFSRAVGTVFMPPKWALGYHQSRWSYESEEEVREERFPDPNSLVDDLHAIGFKAIWMLDPGLKKEEGYFVYDSGSKSDVWTQTDKKEPFVGKVWPGPCVFPDFTQSKVRSWWANLVKEWSNQVQGHICNGADGIWNDMNEPAVWGEVFGMLMAKSTHEGMKLASDYKRPFVLTRAGFVGSQRYAATWTGDNISNWPHLQMSIPMVLNLGLSGQPFSGPDIGGFSGEATAELFGRWMGIGSMLPFSRGHSEQKTKRHEPWSFGEELPSIIFTSFSLLDQRSHTLLDPTDLELRTQENSFLLGPLLVYASTKEHHESDKTEHKLPKGIWRSFDFEDSHPDLPTLYLKGGSIIPIGLPHECVDDACPEDDLTLLVALDEFGKAKGQLFEDDGDGYEYTKGRYLLTTYVAIRKCCVVTVKVSKEKGCRIRPRRRLHVKLLLEGGDVVEAWGIDGCKVYIPVPKR